MFKCLNPAILGLSGRQSELIELTLTYGFKAIELDLPEVARRVEQQGAAAARKLLDSAKLTIGGSELALGWFSDSVGYENELGQVKKMGAAAGAMGVRRVWTYLHPANDERPFHENFQVHCARLRDIAKILGEHQIELGVGIRAAADLRANRAFQFIYQPDQLILLLKSVAESNVGVIVDSWDWYVGSGGSLDALDALGKIPVVGVRLADVPTDADAATITETQRLVPGESGVIDFAGLAQRLAALSADCPVMVHAHPSRFAGLRRDVVVQRVSGVLDGMLSPAAAAPAVGALAGAKG